MWIQGPRHSRTEASSGCSGQAGPAGPLPALPSISQPPELTEQFPGTEWARFWARFQLPAFAKLRRSGGGLGAGSAPSPLYSDAPACGQCTWRRNQNLNRSKVHFPVPSRKVSLSLAPAHPGDSGNQPCGACETQSSHQLLFQEGQKMPPNLCNLSQSRGLENRLWVGWNDHGTSCRKGARSGP